MKRWMPWMLAIFVAAAAGGAWWRVSGDVCEYRVSLPAVQMQLVAGALDAWRADNGTYPQRLDALLTDGPARLGPYRTARDLVDPWGHPLVYSPHADGGGFSLSTLGADGKPGGTGPAADHAVHRPEHGL